MSLAESIVLHANEPHCPVVLLLDTSGSMAGEAITALQEGLESFKQSILKDSLASMRVDLALVTFGSSVEVVQNFAPVKEITMPALEAQGSTPMGEAIALGLRLVEERVQILKNQGTPRYAPWVFLITDGAPTDVHPSSPEWETLRQSVHERVTAKKLSFFPIGVAGADMDTLNQLGKAMHLKGLAFNELFQWVSRSLQAKSRSSTGESIKLESPLNCWAEG